MSSDLHIEPTMVPVEPPTEVLVHQRSQRLELRWPNGHAFSLGHAHLRQACKCAWCEGHRRRRGEPAATAEVSITGVTPVGDVGLQLHFSDGHDRGIYPWSYLHALAT